jgi:putative CocE/NonD family hydrolase
VDHPNYDEFWQVRSVWKHAKNITPAILNVGGWFDAEDPMGPLHMYRSIARLSPTTDNRLVMGPWSHGGWGRGPGDRLGNATFAVKTGEVFRSDVQFVFFMHHLKDPPLPAGFPKAQMFATGINEFRRHGLWPPPAVRPLTLSLQSRGRIAAGAPPASGARTFDEYESDPNRPVPYLGYVASGMTSDYMTEDQRFAATRPDVLVYSSGPLEEDLAVAGPISISLTVSSTGTDSDFVVKLIDGCPATTRSRTAGAAPGNRRRGPVELRRMGGYQHSSAGTVQASSGGFEKPVPLVPGEPTEITFDLPDVYHVFRPGHRLIVQVQSSWFPLVDRNPQRFVEIERGRGLPEGHAARMPRSTLTLPVEWGLRGSRAVVRSQKTEERPQVRLVF